MPESRIPNGQRRELADALRSLRRASGLTGERLAVRTGMSQSKISKIETGRLVPSVADVETLVRALNPPDGLRQSLLSLARAASRDFSTWRVIRRAGLRAKQRELAGIDRGTTEFRYFQTALVPGLLQTPEYARAVMSLPRIAGETDPSAAVASRIERQEVLYDSTKRFWFLITEAALRAQICPANMMSTQVERIIALSHLGNIDVAVVSQDARLPEIPSNSFVMNDDRVVHVEVFHGELVLHDPRDIALHSRIFALFHQAARTGEQAGDLLRDLAGEYRRTTP